MAIADAPALHRGLFTTRTRGVITYDDLPVEPDDGLRYELIDGVLIVSPAPNLNHQVILIELAVALRAAKPDGVLTLVAPFDWKVSDTTVMQPDVVAVRSDEVGEQNLQVPPLLAVEVLSPSNRWRDLSVKRDACARAGLVHYWTVDPEGPSITEHDLIRDAIVQVATGDEPFSVEQPFSVTIVPSSLTKQ